MYSTLITAVALFAAPALAAFAVNEPELTQCGSAKITWQPTKGPYNLIVVDAADPCGEPLAEIGDFDKTFAQWTVNIPEGKVVQVSVADSSDDEAWSGNITIKGSPDTSCLAGATPSSSGAASTSTSTTSSFTGSGSTPGSAGSGSRVAGSDDKTTTEDDNAGDLTPVGAANAGTNSFLNGNAAPAARSLSGPVMALSAIAAVAALAL